VHAEYFSAGKRVVNIYVRVACGLMLSLSSLAMATAEGAVVRFEPDNKHFKSPDISQRQKSLPFWPRKGGSKSAEKNIPTDFWQGRDAHSYFDIETLLNADLSQLPVWLESSELADYLGSLDHGDLLERLRELKAYGREGAHWGEVDAEWLQLQNWLAAQGLDLDRGDYPPFSAKPVSSQVPLPAGLWLMLSGLGFLFTRAVTRKK
jgi:hypothetical protein